MLRQVGLLLSLSTPVLLAVPGCSSSPRQWEVTIENKSDVPCSCFVTLGEDGNSKVKVEDVAKGKSVSLIAGDSKTVVQSIKVVRGKDEQTLTPKAELPVGKRFAIVVSTEAKVETSVLDR